MIGAYDYEIAKAIVEQRINEIQRQAEKERLLSSLPRTQPILFRRLNGIIASLKGRAPAGQIQANPRCVIIYGCACEATECTI
jgi:hypothetical protein